MGLDNDKNSWQYFIHNLKNNNILQKLISICGMNEKNLSNVLSMCENDLKLKGFISLYKNMIEQKEENKKLNLIYKLITQHKKKKIFRALKAQSLFQKNKDYEIKLKRNKEIELQKLFEEQNNQKQQLLILINKAKEKLKHENRKKIQVKLMLDQMVLRGISALNLQAMKLSQDSLKDVVGCDYKKEIDLKYHSMLFPDSKATFVNILK